MHRTTIALADSVGTDQRTGKALTTKAAPSSCACPIPRDGPPSRSASPPVQRALKNIAKGRFPVCWYASGTLDGARARVAYMQDGVTTDSEGNERPRLVRVLEFTDARGATQRVRF